MRLDRFLCEMNMGTRSQVKALIRQGAVTVNGLAVKDADFKIRETEDNVCVRGRTLEYHKFVYYMLNKPAGVVSATRDNTAETVTGLIAAGEGEALGGREIFPVGRLDKDTTGLLILTDDGELAHRLLSPKRHVDKIYRAAIKYPLSEEAARRLTEGVDIGEEKPTLPAKVEVLSDGEIQLTIREGRFHQVKRMLAAVGNQVLALERTGFGPLSLDGGLRYGEYRKLTKEEVEGLHEA